VQATRDPLTAWTHAIEADSETPGDQEFDAVISIGPANVLGGTAG
jgi:hypothetical protein